jgi:hypothetical protein
MMAPDDLKPPGSASGAGRVNGRFVGRRKELADRPCR